MSKKDTLIKINQLYKIFGDGQENALELVKNGIGKEELLEKSNCVLGLNNINLNIKKAKIQVVMGLSGSATSIPLSCSPNGENVSFEDRISTRAPVASWPATIKAFVTMLSKKKIYPAPSTKTDTTIGITAFHRIIVPPSRFFHPTEQTYSLLLLEQLLASIT